jgi:hypothetical protein
VCGYMSVRVRGYKCVSVCCLICTGILMSNTCGLNSLMSMMAKLLVKVC